MPGPHQLSRQSQFGVGAPGLNDLAHEDQADHDLSPGPTEIAGHFSLIGRVVSELSPPSAIKLLESDSFGLVRIGAKYLRRHLAEEQTWGCLESAFAKASVRVQSELLRMLSSCQLPNRHPALNLALSGLATIDREVQLSAARLIAYRFPKHAKLVTELKGLEGSGELERLICFSGNQDLILPLINSYNYPADRVLPPAFGFLVTPDWLVAHFESSPEIVKALVEDCGYSNAPVTEATIELLSSGLMFITTEMFTASDRSELHLRVSEFSRALLGIPLGMTPRTEVAVQLGDALDEALFLAAARDSDRSNIEATRDRDPYNYHNRQDRKIALCYHAPYKVHHSLLITQGIIQAEKLGVPVEQRGAFLVDRAAVELEIGEESHNELRLILSAAWKAWSKSRAFSRLPKVYPVTEDVHAPNLKFAVLEPSRTIATLDLRGFSKGACSVARLASYLGQPNVVEILANAEQAAHGRLPVIGCELQIPRVGTEAMDTLAWKQAFRFFGVDSPRRLEYGSMLELSFKPASAWQVYAQAIELLPSLGLFTAPVEASLHISIEGDLGPDVRYIAFPQQFIRRSTRIPRDDTQRWRMLARGMSKGIVCLNREVESHDGVSKPLYRTELRCYGVAIESDAGKVAVNSDFADDLEAAQLFGAALLSNSPELAEIWREYRAELDAYVERSAPEFRQLLLSDWYEASGDPYDYSLVPKLEIIKRKAAVRTVLQATGLAEQVRQELRVIRDATVTRLRTFLTKAK